MDNKYDSPRITCYLGTHQPSWLVKATVPLFVSYKRFGKYRNFPKSANEWALDSGAFTELSQHGKWTIPIGQYSEEVQQIRQETGRMQWATIQDWLCTPLVLERTGLSIREHQKRTVASLEELRKVAPEVTWLPVLQGWDAKSYLEHLGMYKASGFDLDKEQLVGVGSLAVRQKSGIVSQVLCLLNDEGLRLHAFGLSIAGLSKVHKFVESVDSMVWSFIARRRRIKLAECNDKHSVCNNCLQYALKWHREITNQIRELCANEEHCGGPNSN